VKNNIFIFIFVDQHVVVGECGFFLGLHTWIKNMDSGREDQGQCRQAGEHVAARYTVPHLRSIRGKSVSCLSLSDQCNLQPLLVRLRRWTSISG